MTNELPKVARLATETVTTAAAASTSAAADAAPKMAALGTAPFRPFLDQAGKATEGSMKAAQEIAEFSRGNAELLAQVTQTWFAGSQDLGRQAFAFAQSLTDHALEGARALSGVRSLKEAAEIQATYARGTMDRVMTETAKLQEASFRLAEQVAAPVTQRMTVAMERAAKPLAA